MLGARRMQGQAFAGFFLASGRDEEGLDDVHPHGALRAEGVHLTDFF